MFPFLSIALELQLCIHILQTAQVFLLLSFIMFIIDSAEKKAPSGHNNLQKNLYVKKLSIINPRV